MASLRRLLARLLHNVRVDAAESELEREVSAHLGVLEDEFKRRGMTGDEARLAARRAMGGIDRAKELQRDARSFPWLEDLRRDTHYAIRALARAKGFTTVVLLTLGIGIGATTAMFSVMNAVLIRPLSFRDPGRLVYIGMSNPRFAEGIAAGGGTTGLPPSYADIRDLQSDAKSFSSLTIFSASLRSVTGDGFGDLIGATRVSGRFFETLGVSPATGRPLGPEDDHSGSEPVAIISRRLWQSRFQQTPDVLGRFIGINGQRHRIVGVMPAHFNYPTPLEAGMDSPAPTDVWVSMRLSAEELTDRDLVDASGAIGRLRNGVSFEQARSETSALIAAGDRLRRAEWRGWYGVMDWVRESSIRGVRRSLWLLFGGVFLLLLVACSNAAHLFLTRTAGRAHELNVRAALGAGGGRLVRQLMTEAGMLAVGGALLGLAVTLGAVKILPLFDPGTVPRLDETSVDWRVFSFSAALCAMTALAFGLFPALAVSRGAGSPSLHQGARTTSNLSSRHIRHGLIVGQVALALVLLAGAALLIRSYVHVQRLDPGFSASALTMRVSLGDGYPQASQRNNFFQRLLKNIRALPGVEAAGTVTTLPLSHSGNIITLEAVEGRTVRPGRMVDIRTVGAQYFDAVGTRLISGRLINDADFSAKRNIRVVNRAFEREYFPGESAVGKHIRESGPEWIPIVGVVADVRHDNLEDAPRPQVYWPMVEAPDGLFLSVRTRASTDVTLQSIRRAIHDLDPAVTIGDAQLMADRVSSSMALRRFQTSLLAGFAVIAVLVAGIGLYGLMAYTVRQRTTEIGIRLSLGASVRRVLMLVLGQGVKLTLFGIVLGLAGAFGLTRLLASMLYGVAPTDPLAFVSVAIVLLLVGGASSYIPARRAANVDPVIALRSE